MLPPRRRPTWAAFFLLLHIAGTVGLVENTNAARHQRSGHSEAHRRKLRARHSLRTSERKELFPPVPRAAFLTGGGSSGREPVGSDGDTSSGGPPPRNRQPTSRINPTGDDANKGRLNPNEAADAEAQARTLGWMAQQIRCGHQLRGNTAAYKRGGIDGEHSLLRPCPPSMPTVAPDPGLEKLRHVTESGGGAGGTAVLKAASQQQIALVSASVAAAGMLRLTAESSSLRTALARAAEAATSGTPAAHLVSVYRQSALHCVGPA